MTLISNRKDAKIYHHIDFTKEYPCRGETASYKPIAHYDFLNELINELGRQGWTITETMIEITCEGDRMRGTLSLTNEEHRGQEYCPTIGFKNSYDRSMSLGLCGGLTVIICSNGVFSGQFNSVRVHKPGTDYQGFIKAFVGTFDDEYNIIKSELIKTKRHPLSNGDSAMILIHLLKEKIILEKHLLGAWEDIIYTPHNFPPKTVFSLIMALTHQAKKMSAPEKLYKWINLNCFGCEPYELGENFLGKDSSSSFEFSETLELADESLEIEDDDEDDEDDEDEIFEDEYRDPPF